MHLGFGPRVHPRPKHSMASKAMRKFIPLLDRVLVEKVEPLKKSIGGVILPDSAVSKVRACARPR